MIRTKNYTMISVDVLCSYLEMNRADLQMMCRRARRPLWRLNTQDGEFWEVRSTVTLVSDLGTSKQSNIIREVVRPLVKARTLTSRQKNAVAAQQQWKCMRCKNMLSATFEIDHIVDFACQHNDSRDNLQALCPECHRAKTFDSDMYGDIFFGLESRSNLQCDEQNRKSMPSSAALQREHASVAKGGVFSKYFLQNANNSNS